VLKWRYAGIPAWREFSNHFREPLERSLLDFKDLIISKRSIHTGGSLKWLETSQRGTLNGERPPSMQEFPLKHTSQTITDVLSGIANLTTAH